MQSRPIDSAWQWLTRLFSEVLMPLVVFAPALFMCLGYSLALFTPIRIEHWQALLWISLLLSLVPLGIRSILRLRRDDSQPTPFTWRALLPLLPLLIFLPMFFAELGIPSIQIRHHADWHVPYVHELLYRAAPPQNIFVPGYPASFYWLYHALLAALVQITGLAPTQLASIVNIIAIVASCYWLARIIINLGLARPGTLLLGLLVVLVYCAINITAPLSWLASILTDNYHSNSLKILLLPHGDTRLESVMNKVMNFNSTGIGILCFIAALHCCLRFLQGRLDRLGLILLGACFLLSLAVRQSAALFIALVLLGGGAVGFGMFFDPGARGRPPGQLVKETISRLQPRFVAIWLVASLLLTLLLLHYYVGFTATSQVGARLQLFVPGNISMLVTALLVFLPLLLLQTVFALRNRSWLSLFLPVCAWLGLLLTAVLILPSGDQHKAVYYLAILVALSALLALQSLEKRLDHGRVRPVRWVTLWLVALAFAQVMIVKHYWDVRAKELHFAYDGPHINYLGGHISQERIAAYTWMRENTSPYAIIVLPLTIGKFEYMLHERQVYLRAKRYWFAENIPSYDRRVNHVHQLLSMETTAEDYFATIDEMSAELPDRDFYAVIADAQVPAQIMASRGAEQVFTGTADEAHVYLLNPGAGQGNRVEM